MVCLPCPLFLGCLLLICFKLGSSISDNLEALACQLALPLVYICYSTERHGIYPSPNIEVLNQISISLIFDQKNNCQAVKPDSCHLRKDYTIAIHSPDSFPIFSILM